MPHTTWDTTTVVGEWKRTAEPADTPVSVAELKGQSVYEETDPDQTVVLTRCIQATTNFVEQFLNRQLITATYTLKFDSFRDPIVLPFPPLIAVEDDAIAYTDTSGASQTVTASLWEKDTQSEPGLVLLSYNQSWPSDVRTSHNGITITYTAGYGTAQSSVPANIRHAILMGASDLFEHRESQSEIRLQENQAFMSLLWPYRIDFI
ncbi:hypothetical protein LCGC14_1967100 [marine sediment metagenome]|uniref:Phage gp6-like head-tail connector protein n=1 Tax=marine sediment metagenome TaxID=412755 RepID=A0A0F9HR99_9ZZZZ